MDFKRITHKLISDVISNYNSTVHRSIGMTPNEAKGQVMEADLTHNQEEDVRKGGCTLEQGCIFCGRD
ncbi:hypothetical protein Plhal703r1_c23g0097531 [Plasmopara halstedii]